MKGNANIRVLSWAPVLLAGLVLAIGCTKKNGGEGGEAEAVQVKGSDTLLHLSTEWAEAFMKANPDREVVITGGGSGTGIAALLNGTCDVANASRKIKDKERALAKEKGKEIKEITVARDGISVIVHPSNSVEELSLEQLKKIFTGRYTNWKELGGGDKDIIVLSRDHSSGTYAFFQKRVLDKEEYTETAKFLASNSAIVATVAEDAGSIGYVGLGYYEDAKDKVRALAVKDGEKKAALPSVETVRDGSYPIARTLQVYVVGEPRGTVKAFVDFALSAEGQNIVGEKGFVPLR